MTITLDIGQEASVELARRALMNGQPVELYAAGLLEKVATKEPVTPSIPENMVELFAPLRGLNITFEQDRGPDRDIHL